MVSRLILLINETNDDGLEEIITACLNHVAGWNVISISSRYKSLSPLLKKQPDAILVNALLSNLDGLSFNQKYLIQSLKQHPLTQFSPILLLIDTANWLSSSQLQSWGIVGALAKPFNPITLPSQITEILCWEGG